MGVVAYLSLFTYHGREQAFWNFTIHIYSAMKPTIARHSDMPGRKFSASA